MDGFDFSIHSERDDLELLAFYCRMNSRFGWSEDLFRWQYRANPAGFARTMVARKDGQIYGAISAVPSICQHSAGLQFVNFRLQDFMVHPAFTQELRPLLIESFNNLIQASEAPGAFAFPSKELVPLLLDAGWTSNQQVNTWMLKNLGSKSQDSAEPGTLRDSSVSRLEDSTDRSLAFKSQISRTETYLAWRYDQNPRRAYTRFDVTQGDARKPFVLKVYNSETLGRIGHLCEVGESASESGFGNALRAAKNLALATSCVGLSLWLPSGSNVEASMRNEDFKMDSTLNRSYFRKSFSVPPEPLEKWHFTMGDSDIF